MSKKPFDVNEVVKFFDWLQGQAELGVTGGVHDNTIALTLHDYTDGECRDDEFKETQFFAEMEYDEDDLRSSNLGEILDKIEAHASTPDPTTVSDDAHQFFIDLFENQLREIAEHAGRLVHTHLTMPHINFKKTADVGKELDIDVWLYWKENADSHEYNRLVEIFGGPSNDQN